MPRTKKRSSKGRKSNMGGGTTKEQWRQRAMHALRLAKGHEEAAKKLRNQALEMYKKANEGTTTTRATSSQRGGSKKKGKTHRHRKSRK
jgi:hypothetical protein